MEWLRRMDPGEGHCSTTGSIPCAKAGSPAPPHAGAPGRRRSAGPAAGGCVAPPPDGAGSAATVLVRPSSVSCATLTYLFDVFFFFFRDAAPDALRRLGRLGRPAGL